MKPLLQMKHFRLYEHVFIRILFVSFQAHVVAAFEQSLSNMTSRLQHLTSTSEQKVRSSRIQESIMNVRVG